MAYQIRNSTCIEGFLIQYEVWDTIKIDALSIEHFITKELFDVT